MRSRQRKTFKFREQTTGGTGSPVPGQGPSHSRSRQGQFKPSQGQPSGGLNQRQQLQRLVKQNKELKKQIIQLKVSQFYNFDDSKLKQLIEEVQSLRKQIKIYQQQIHDLQMHNDFLTRTNLHLKHELEKEIQQRTKSLRKQDNRLTHAKQTDHTLNTDCSRNQEEELSHLTYSSSNVHFLQNVTLEDSKDILKGMDYQSGTLERSVEKGELHPRKSLMQKILSPRRKEKSPGGDSNEYLLYRRQKDKKNTCS